MLSQFRGSLEGALGDRLLAIRVFGSRARGTAKPDSDLDVLVKIDRRDRPTRKQILNLAEDVNEAFDFAIVLSPLVLGEAEYENLRAHERRLALDIEAEGIAV